MSYASSRPKFSGRTKKPRKCVKSMLAALAKRPALTVAEAIRLADEIEELMAEFKFDIENGRDDPASQTTGWKDGDAVNESEHEDGAVYLLNAWRDRKA